MRRKSSFSPPQDSLDRFQLDQADQAVVDLAFEEAVEAMITCACHQAMVAEPRCGSQSLLTSSEIVTMPSASNTIVQHTVTTSYNSSAPVSVSATTDISTPISNYGHQILDLEQQTRSVLPKSTSRSSLTGLLAEVFAPEIVAQVNQACQSKQTNAQNTRSVAHNISCCNCSETGQVCNSNCTQCEEVTMDQLQLEQNSISGNQSLYHTTEINSTTTSDKDPVFSYHLYNHSYTHHPCEHDLQTYDPSNDKIEITVCRDKYHGISFGEEASMADHDMECYELDFANEQELLDFIYQDSNDFFSELQLDQLLLESQSVSGSKSKTPINKPTSCISSNISNK